MLILLMMACFGNAAEDATQMALSGNSDFEISLISPESNSTYFLFTEKHILFIGRFSNPGSDPESSDKGTMPRGLALQFKGPGGHVSNMSMITMSNRENVAPMTSGCARLCGGHAQCFSRAARTQHSLKYWRVSEKVSAVGTNSDGKSQFVRWNFIADAGEKYLSAAELKDRDKNFLFQGISGRAKSKPSWTMEAVDGPCTSTNFDPHRLDKIRFTLAGPPAAMVMSCHVEWLKTTGQVNNGHGTFCGLV